MATRQYIGARYVPKFANPIEWSKEKSYEALTIVTYLNNSYTSKKSVPANTEITDTNYWVITGNYNAQVEQYRQEVTKVTNKTKCFIDLDTDNAQEIIDTTDYAEYVICNGNGKTLVLNINKSLILTGCNCKVHAQITINESYVTIKDFDFIGNNDTCILINKGRFVNIENNKFSNYTYAIATSTIAGNIDGTRDSLFHTRGIVSIVNNNFIGNAYAIYGDINTDTTNDNVPLSERWMRNNDWLISGNMINIANITGIWFRGIDGCTITDNTIFLSSARNTCENGIKILESNYLIISGNKIFEAGNEAIYLEKSRYVTISSNHLAWCGYFKVSNNIEITNLIDINISIVNNVIDRYTGKYGIYIDDTSKGLSNNCVISNNTINAIDPQNANVKGVEDKLGIFCKGDELRITNNSVLKANDIVAECRNNRGSLDPLADALTQIKELPIGVYRLNCNASNNNDTLHMPEAKNMVIDAYVFDNGYTEVKATPLNENYCWRISLSGGIWGNWEIQNNSHTDILTSGQAKTYKMNGNSALIFCGRNETDYTVNALTMWTTDSFRISGNSNDISIKHTAGQNTFTVTNNYSSTVSLSYI